MDVRKRTLHYQIRNFSDLVSTFLQNIFTNLIWKILLKLN